MKSQYYNHWMSEKWKLFSVKVIMGLYLGKTENIL